MPQKPKSLALNREPAYQPVAAILRQEIRESLPAGSRLPTERSLEERFRVSLTTIREAMARLEQEGLIERRRGSGTYVAERPVPARHVGVLLDVDISSAGLSPYYLTMVQAVRRNLGKLGVPSRAYFGFQSLGPDQGSLTCTDLQDDLKLGRLEGLIVLFMGQDTSWLRAFEEANVPVLDFHYLDEDGSWPMKSHFISTAFGYLTRKKRQRIAILANEGELDERRPLSNLIRKLAPEFGIQTGVHLMDMHAKGWQPGMGWERFREMWVANPVKPDALIIADESLFADCQKAIRELQIAVPEAMDVVVRSSDAVELDPEFPVLVWKYEVAKLAFLYAQRMKEILSSSEQAPVTEWPVSVQIEGPGYRTRLLEEAPAIEISELLQSLTPSHYSL